MNDQELVRYLSEIITQGNGSYAKRRLNERISRVSKEPIEPPFRVAFAGLCRRAGSAEWGLNLLNPLIRAEIEGIRRATPDEKTEYGACLSQIGALAEAERVLTTVDVKLAPQALLFRAFCLFAQWDYAQSLPLLRKYLSHLTDGSYAYRVGQINLASALSHAELPSESEALCREIIEKTAREGRLLLEGNAYEILGRTLMESGNWNLAKQCFKTSEMRLTKMGTTDLLFLRKWEAVLDIRQHGPVQEKLMTLEVIRLEAQQKFNWETARDCDFQAAIVTGDHERLRRVYFGTPFPSYRSKLLRACARSNISEDLIRNSPYIWRNLGNGQAEHSIDIHRGTCTCGKFHLKRDQLIQRLFVALCSDFYRPARTATLFSLLYSGENFHPRSSPLRVRQALKRLRAELQQQKHRIEIVESRSSYRMDISNQNSIQLLMHEKESHPDLIFLQEALEGRVEFSTEDAAQIWDLSPRSALRRLQVYVAKGELSRMGSTRGCRFKIA